MAEQQTGQSFIDVESNYTFNVQIGSGTSLVDVGVAIRSDADFAMRGLQMSFLSVAAAQSGIAVRLRDSQGHYLSSVEIPVPVLSSDPASPWVFRPEVVYPAGGRIGIDIMYPGAPGQTANMEIIFRGVKRYWLKGQRVYRPSPETPPGFVDMDFTYPFPVSLAVNAPPLMNQSVIVENDADFVWTSTILYLSGDAIGLQYQVMQGYYLSSGFNNSANQGSGGSAPYANYPEILIPAGGRIGLNLTRLLQVNNTTGTIFFRGVKRYRVGTAVAA
jgi:hypothetical protein